VIALTLLLGSGLVMAARAAANQRAILLAAHVSFLLLNMATMPMWQIEGLILYALLWGFTLYGVRLKRAVPVRPSVPAPNIRRAVVRSSRPKANPV
jgi:hypothetical protein